MGRNNTSRKICWAVGKDEVPGPNPGSSSMKVRFSNENRTFCNIFSDFLYDGTSASNKPLTKSMGFAVKSGDFLRSVGNMI